jgi:hypothetical protein
MVRRIKRESAGWFNPCLDENGKLFSGVMKWKLTGTEWKIAISMLLVGLAFAACTQHIWEDYWITFRCSRNLAMGHGLVYTVGERLHSFTSPLGVLLPALLCWLTGGQSDNLVLWLFRVASLGALAAGMVLFFQTLQTLRLRPTSCWLTLGLLGLDAKIVDFSINGMETGLLIFFLALTIHGLIVAGPRQVLRIGVGWAGLMWTRPDSCIYIAILGAGALLFLSGRTEGKSRVEWGKLLFRAGVICAVLYVGWFVWTWWYYGTPVPHTITAKRTNKPPLLFVDLITDLVMFPVQLLAPFATSMQFTFLPGYSDHGGWSSVLSVASYALGILAAFGWVLPAMRPATRLLSLAYFLGNFYLTAILKYHPPWYLPTVEVFGFLTLGLLFDQVLAPVEKLSQLAGGWRRQLHIVLNVFAIGLVVGQVAVTSCVAYQLRLQQELIENSLRRPIGLWLRDHARTLHDTVMLESLGYIGYYSGLKMLDYPGLASMEVIETRKRLGPLQEDRIGFELKPDWLVLRPCDLFAPFPTSKDIQQFYDLVQVFDATDKINAVRWLPGRPYLEFDQTFLIFHRKPDAAAKPTTSESGQ